MRMKLGAQEVRTALRRTHTSLAGVVARVRAFVGSAYVSSLRALNSFLFPRLSAEADEVLSKSAVDAWSVRMSRFATIALIGSVLQTVLLPAQRLQVAGGARRGARPSEERPGEGDQEETE